MFEMNSFLNRCCDQQLRAIYGALENTMKYSMKNLKIASPEIKVEFAIESIEVEYNLSELKQFALNGQLIMNTIKEAVKEIVPLIVMMQDHEAQERRIRHAEETARR